MTKNKIITLCASVAAALIIVPTCLVQCTVVDNSEVGIRFKRFSLTEQGTLKAENLIKQAEANAKIEIAKAEGTAKALKIQADGEAYYNRTVAASLNELLVRQDAIEKWDGKMPTYNGSGVLPFVNIDK